MGLASIPGCGVGYLLQQGYYQAELLAGRKPIEKAIEKGHFDEKQIEKLRLVPKIKEYGKGIGLSATDNYETINPTWKRTIWNVSACDPVSFSPKTWWFPIVGRMPYLGYFEEKDARKRAEHLEDDGLDVYVRTAGAYSTLGWFKDPVLLNMLNWSEHSLADTILHELAHATLWIPGSVQFNESFANFVGEEAAMRYMVATYGDDGAPVVEVRHRLEDSAKFRGMLHDVYLELDEVYKNSDMDRFDKLVRKHSILASLPTRTAALGLHREDAYLKSIREGEWNNARLMQFRTYNRSREWFAALLEQENGDLLAFIHRIDEITKDQEDPYRALALAVGANPDEASEKQASEN